MSPSNAELSMRWAEHNDVLRDPASLVGYGAPQVDAQLLRYSVRGAWWEALARTGATLLVSREYEHFVLALQADNTGISVTYMALPHPSGIAIDQANCAV